MPDPIILGTNNFISMFISSPGSCSSILSTTIHSTWSSWCSSSPAAAGGRVNIFTTFYQIFFPVSPERHAVCSLCGQRFLRRHAKLLAFHLQQQHRDTMLALLHHTNQVNYKYVVVHWSTKL